MIGKKIIHYTLTKAELAEIDSACSTLQKLEHLYDEIGEARYMYHTAGTVDLLLNILNRENCKVDVIN